MSKLLIKVTPETLINMTGRLQQNMDQLTRLADEQKVLIQQINEALDGCEEIARYCEELQISMSHLHENLCAAKEIRDFANYVLTTLPPSPPSIIIP